MNTTRKQILHKEVTADLETGVFDLFPKLKGVLENITSKLFESMYVINSSKELSDRDINTLKEQGYTIW